MDKYYEALIKRLKKRTEVLERQILKLQQTNARLRMRHYRQRRKNETLISTREALTSALVAK